MFAKEGWFQFALNADARTRQVCFQSHLRASGTPWVIPQAGLFQQIRKRFNAQKPRRIQQGEVRSAASVGKVGIKTYLDERFKLKFKYLTPTI